MNRNFFFSLTVVITLLFLNLSCTEKREPLSWQFKKIVTTPKLQKPTDIIRFKGHFVACELKKSRLAYFTDLSFAEVKYFNPRKIGKRFHAPHFLAVSQDDKLLISNGWGKSIVAITSLNGEGWQEFKGDDKGFNAPHGICVDNNGWIYVGDSLNSRLVRFRDMQGTDWQVFPDIDNLLAYSRQIVCADNAVWVSNSYEKRNGLNVGQGSNVLKISDFSSGKAEIVYSTNDTNITGILPVKNQLFVALWQRDKSIVIHDMKSGFTSDLENSKNELGVPYSLHREPDQHNIIATYFGSFKDNMGGFATFSAKVD